MDRLTRPVFCDLMCGRDQATYRTGVVVSKRRVRSNRHHLPTSVNRTPRPKKLGRSVVSAILLLVGLLVSIPVSALAMVHAYRILSGQAASTSQQTPTAA